MKFKNHYNLLFVIFVFFFNVYSNGEILPFKDIESFVLNMSSAENLRGDNLFKRALLVHTADRTKMSVEEINYGWGRVDLKKADKFLQNRNSGSIVNDYVSFNKTHFLTYKRIGDDPVIATLAWDEIYKQDLDIRVINEGNVTFPISIDENGHLSLRKDNRELTIERVDLTSQVKDEFIIQITSKNRPRIDIPFTLLVSGAQYSEKVMERLKHSEVLKQKDAEREKRILEYLKRTGEKRSVKLDNGGKRIIIDIKDDVPIYKSTCNYNAAKSNGVTPVQPNGDLGLNLTGENLVNSIIVWDGGNALRTHQEFDNRVTYGENVGSEEHGTHVAGTIMASGIQSNARGMAYKAELKSYDFSNDESEMNYEASNGCILSNHSYMSGQFSSYGRDWDIIANNNPYYSIMKAAANEGPSYNTMPINSNSKNVLTIGSGADQPNGYVGPNISVSSFSSRGPTPDGRIKPDFIANGAGLYSTSNSSSTGYTSMSGTSMACPSATGAAALIQEHYYMTHGNVYMMSSTLKGLIINSADEVGADGPDYNSGYGYINAGSACKIISDNNSGKGNLINEITLLNGDKFEIDVIPIPGEEVKVTLCWNDPAASSSSGTNSKLVNDLDLRISNGGTEYLPWRCNPNSPSSPATQGDNSADNVEKIQVDNITSSLTVSVSHKGSLSNSQIFSLVMSGVIVNTDPFIDVKAPVENDELEQYSQMKISWVSNIDDNVSIELYKGQSPLETLADNIENSGSLLWDIPEDFDLGDDYKIKVSSVTVDTIYDFSNEFSIVEEFLLTELPYKEDFDTLDTNSTILPKGYSQSTNDDIDWLVFSGPTPSKVGISPDVTGPDGDNTTGNGNYIYVEASDPNNPGKIAYITTPKFTLIEENKPILIFSYHMYSDTGAMGSLVLDINSDGEITNRVIELDDSDYGDLWHTDTIDLVDFAGKRVSFTFKGSTGSLWASDICLDDIVIVNTSTVDNIEIVDPADIRAKGFRIGPNPSVAGEEVHFTFQPAKEAIQYGNLDIYDLVGNKLFTKDFGYCKADALVEIGVWDIRNKKGIRVSKGTYLVHLTVKDINGETYRIKKHVGIK